MREGLGRRDFEVISSRYRRDKNYMDWLFVDEQTKVDEIYSYIIGNKF